MVGDYRGRFSSRRFSDDSDDSSDDASSVEGETTSSMVFIHIPCFLSFSLIFLHVCFSSPESESPSCSLLRSEFLRRFNVFDGISAFIVDYCEVNERVYLH